MNFLPENIDSYIESHTAEEPELLKELNRETYAKILVPRMLSGHYQGRLLSMLSYMIKPKRILEIGTYTGYSALCLAEGLQADGIIHTIDINEELEHFVRQYLNQSKYGERIIQHIGDAIQIVPTLKEEWDIVFIDADKHNYINYYNLVFDRVKQGGYILVDNVLWSGKVTEENSRESDLDTATLHQFNELVQGDNRVENLLLGVRDGVMVIRKK